MALTFELHLHGIKMVILFDLYRPNAHNRPTALPGPLKWR